VPVRVDVWSDLVCPWCHVGLHRLRRVAAAEGLDLDLVHHAFQLDPGRAASEPTRDALRRRYGGDVDAMMARAQAAAHAEGMPGVELGRTVAANTRDGHRVAALAKRQGLQDQAVERLMRAHFEEGADLGDRATLVRLAGEAGLDEGVVRAMLETGELQEEVQRDLDEARALGVHGVPFFVVDSRLAFSGAQPDAVFLEAFRRAAAPAATP